MFKQWFKIIEAAVETHTHNEGAKTEDFFEEISHVAGMDESGAHSLHTSIYSITMYHCIG